MEKQKQNEKRRKRKKKLLNSIREQIEFYFSDANLRHDRFMRQLVAAEDPEAMGRKSVDLNEFFKFNKISEMTKKIRDITLSLESSKCLSLDQNQLTVKRNEPYVQKEDNYDESTIYVERLPPNADQQWIRSVFSGFGQIEYIKIPHFRHNNNIMGFAFIEFSRPESAQKAVKHFNIMSSNDHKNQSLTETESEVEEVSTSSQIDNKITKSDVSRKRTLESDNEELIETKRIKTSEENESKEKSETIEDISETNVKIKKKKKRKRKRKTVTTPPSEDNEQEVINLRVMSKKEWKKWKNKYLKLQKQTMSSIKRSLLVENENTETTDNQMIKVENNCEDRHFESGLIIKLKFSMPSKDLNEFEFKRNIRQMGAKNEIQYIDLPLNRLEFCGNQTVEGICFIRTISSEDCKRLVGNQKLKQLGDLSVLEANEETEYWNQIFDQRIKKKTSFNENNKNKTKVRGFDRIINRAENVSTSVDTNPKPNKYIKFET